VVALFLIDIRQFLSDRSCLFLKADGSRMNFIQCENQDLLFRFNILYGIQTSNKVDEGRPGDDERDRFSENGIDKGLEVVGEGGGCRGVDAVQQSAIRRQLGCLGLDALDFWHGRVRNADWRERGAEGGVGYRLAWPAQTLPDARDDTQNADSEDLSGVRPDLHLGLCELRK
jgi:hypothetical protein